MKASPEGIKWEIRIQGPRPQLPTTHDTTGKVQTETGAEFRTQSSAHSIEYQAYMKLIVQHHPVCWNNASHPSDYCRKKNSELPQHYLRQASWLVIPHVTLLLSDPFTSNVGGELCLGRPRHISQVVLDIGDVSLQPKNHQAGPQGNAPKPWRSCGNPWFSWRICRMELFTGGLVRASQG